MEAVEEPPLQNSSVEVGVKLNTTSDDSLISSDAVTVCHKSNGKTLSADSDVSQSENAVQTPLSDDPRPDTNPAFVSDDIEASSTSLKAPSTVDSNNDVEEATVAEVLVPLPLESEKDDKKSETDNVVVIETQVLGINDKSKKTEDFAEDTIQETEKIICQEDIPFEDTTVEIISAEVIPDSVTFKTEVLIEKNGKDMIEYNLNETAECEHDAANSILKDLGQNIELSEVLRSSDVAENVENNNCSVRQEVFNKEELLDILEGNEPPGIEISDIPEAKSTGKLKESEIALQQLTRLKRMKDVNKVIEKDKLKRKKNVDKMPRKRQPKKVPHGDNEVSIEEQENTSTLDSDNDNTVTKKKQKKISSSEEDLKDSEPNNIVNVLVKDWDDDEAVEENNSETVLEDPENSTITNDPLIKEQEVVIKTEETVNSTSVDSIKDDNIPASSKSGDESQPQRRIGRVIKKKVIFDPDNPDTFTKGKTPSKSKEPLVEKSEQVLIKKVKPDQTLRSNSKSPISKLQWKKPSPKNSKQNRRLTEVDKLLMDEGAVNMIYQLTPEAPKGKKNMKTKAEFIKKLQSSTPDGKEMKFRERKKEIKCEEGEAKKILSGKQRSSMSSSVKSPICEDFETHSADDSIIYRRHSSSSYSSSCMSPLRVNDTDSTVTQSAARLSRQPSDSQNQNNFDPENHADVFMMNASNSSSNDLINKNDCLSIKEKLNSKLSLAFNKRKRESAKTEKPSKLRKATKTDEKDSLKIKNENGHYKYLSISFDQRLAEICIRKPGAKCSIETIKELEKALVYINNQRDVTVTLLTSGCGTLCSGLDLNPLLDEDIEKRTNSAYEIAEAVRSLVCCFRRHTKLLCAGVWGPCTDISLVLLALCDVTLASHAATFSLGETQTMDEVSAPLVPGIAVFTSQCRLFPQSFINDVLVFGRQLSASEAHLGGLVSRVLWPERCAEQMRAIVQDIAGQPPQSVLLKKQLLGLKNAGESETTFLSCLETERDLLVDYWTSAEGQQMIHATLKE